MKRRSSRHRFWLENMSANGSMKPRKLAVQGQLAAAESLLHQALDYYPVSKNANFRLGRHYFDNGQQERGLQVLRRNSMLLEVPRLTEAPKIDGLLGRKNLAKGGH